MINSSRKKIENKLKKFKKTSKIINVLFLIKLKLLIVLSYILFEDKNLKF